MHLISSGKSILRTYKHLSHKFEFSAVDLKSCLHLLGYIGYCLCDINIFIEMRVEKNGFINYKSYCGICEWLVASLTHIFLCKQYV